MEIEADNLRDQPQLEIDWQNMEVKTDKRWGVNQNGGLNQRKVKV